MKKSRAKNNIERLFEIRDTIFSEEWGEQVNLRVDKYKGMIAKWSVGELNESLVEICNLELESAFWCLNCVEQYISFSDLSPENRSEINRFQEALSGRQSFRFSHFFDHGIPQSVWVEVAKEFLDLVKKRALEGVPLSEDDSELKIILKREYEVRQKAISMGYTELLDLSGS